MKQYDAIIMYGDAKLTVLFGLLRWCIRPSLRMVQLEFYFDTAEPVSGEASVASRMRRALRNLFYQLLVFLSDVIIVHSEQEVEDYSKYFHAPPGRFRFIPYYAYADAKSWQQERHLPSNAPSYVLAVGRHRDYRCFIEALRNQPWQAVIIAGDSDRPSIGTNLPVNIKVHYELPFEKYRDYIANAAVLVIPLSDDTCRRSLGQIAFLEASQMRIPVVAAKTFQLTNYASDQEVLFYAPGNAEELRRQIQRLFEEPELRDRLTRRAFVHVASCFTMENYVIKLLHACGI